jgi:serralysin
MAQANRVCLCREGPTKPAGQLMPAGDVMLMSRSRAAVLRSAFWGVNRTISIAFLDGQEALQRKVAEAAKLWITDGGAKVTLNFWIGSGFDPKNAEVRIAFVQDNRSWSHLGTECLSIHRDQPTMNYGWLNQNSDDETIRSVVLHEFGHALGLIHEHQNPNGAIVWNREQVLSDLRGPPNFWDDATIEFNMFRHYEKEEVYGTQADPHSIMMYEIPANWTMNGFQAPKNTRLSANDKALIKAAYFG